MVAILKQQSFKWTKLTFCLHGPFNMSLLQSGTEVSAGNISHKHLQDAVNRPKKWWLCCREGQHVLSCMSVIFHTSKNHPHKENAWLPDQLIFTYGPTSRKCNALLYCWNSLNRSTASGQVYGISYKRPHNAPCFWLRFLQITVLQTKVLCQLFAMEFLPKP